MLSFVFFVIFKKCTVFFLTKEGYKTEFKRLFCHCILVWFTFIMFKSFSCNKTKDRAPKQDWLELPHGSRLSSYPKTTHFRSNHRRNDNSMAQTCKEAKCPKLTHPPSAQCAHAVDSTVHRGPVIRGVNGF